MDMDNFERAGQEHRKKSTAEDARIEQLVMLLREEILPILPEAIARFYGSKEKHGGVFINRSREREIILDFGFRPGPPLTQTDTSWSIGAYGGPKSILFIDAEGQLVWARSYEWIQSGGSRLPWEAEIVDPAKWDAEIAERLIEFLEKGEEGYRALKASM